MRCSLRAKLILMICMPLAAAYLVLFAVEYRTIRSTILEQTKSLVSEIVMHRVEDLNHHLEAVSEVADSVAEFLTDHPTADPKAIEQLLETSLKWREPVFGIRVVWEAEALHPASGRLGLYLRRDLATNEVRRLMVAPSDIASDWYSSPKAFGKSVWTEPCRDTINDAGAMCIYSTPFFHNGQFAGVVTVDLSLEHFGEEIFKAYDPSVYFFALSRTGKFVAHPAHSLVLNKSIFTFAEKRNLQDVTDLGRKMLAGKQGLTMVKDPDTGEPQLVLFAPLKPTGWSLAVVDPEKTTMAHIYHWLHWRIFKIIAGLAIVVVIVFVVSGQLVRPLRLLTASAQSVAKGNLDAEVKGIQSGDEIGQLAATFNQMLQDLKATIEAKGREVAIRKAIERDLQIARQIQVSLLPSAQHPFPEHHEFTLYAGNEPAHYIAGDFYDFWLLDDETLALAIADVSGDGIPAAMFMAVCRTTLRNLTLADRNPGQTLTLANQFLADHNDKQMFATVFLAHYHIKTGEIVFANAGHNPPYLVHKGNTIESLGMPTGPLLGIWDGVQYTDKRNLLGPEDVLVLYTDGVTETVNSAEQMLDSHGLEHFLAQAETSSAEILGQSLLRHVAEYRYGPTQDDVTLLVLRRS